MIWNEIKDSQMTFFWFIWHVARRGYHSQIYIKAELPIWCLKVKYSKKTLVANAKKEMNSSGLYQGLFEGS